MSRSERLGMQTFADVDDGGAMQQAVERDRCHHGVVTKHRTPFAEGLVGGEGERLIFLVAAADHLKQQARLHGVERQIPALGSEVVVEVDLRNVSFIDNHEKFQAADDRLSWVIADLRLGGFNWPIDVVRATKALSGFVSGWQGRCASSVHLGDGAFLSVDQSGVVLTNGLGEEYRVAAGGNFEALLMCCRLLVRLSDALAELDPALLPMMDELLDPLVVRSLMGSGE